MPAHRPVMLVILDGWGWREEAADNAVRQARTPAFDRLWQSSPHAFLRTSGRDVGLPDGQMGNSEVGHLNIGAGRVVMQDLPRINEAIADRHARRSARPERPRRRAARLGRHLPSPRPDLAGRRAFAPGPCGGAGRHPHASRGADRRARLHRWARHAAEIGGRRISPRFAPRCRRRCRSPPSAAATSPWTATSAGSASRKPTRPWRTGRARASPRPRPPSPTPMPRDISDEFVVPAVIGGYAGMKDGDGLLSFNFRADRVREILAALLDPAFAGFPRRRADPLRRRSRHDAIQRRARRLPARRCSRRRT